MKHVDPTPREPTLKDQLIAVDRQEHLDELSRTGDDLLALLYRQRELVARVLAEGGSWADVAAAAGCSVRTARRRWSSAPSGSITESRRAALDAGIRGSRGTGSGPLQGY